MISLSLELQSDDERTTRRLGRSLQTISLSTCSDRFRMLLGIFTIERCVCVCLAQGRYRKLNPHPSVVPLRGEVVLIASLVHFAESQRAGLWIQRR